MSLWLISALCCTATLAGTAAQDPTARGAHLNTTGVQNLNLTLSTIQGTASGSSPSYCDVVGIPEPYTFYATDGAAPEVNMADPYALIEVDVALGGSASVTFYGGNITTQGAPNVYTPPFVTTVSNSSIAVGPLYITKTLINTSAAGYMSYRLDYAQFFPTAVGQTEWFYGGLGEIDSAPACIYNISFTGVPM